MDDRVNDQHVRVGSVELPADFVPLRLVLKASGASVELTRPDMILGRHSEADVRLPLPDVSRRHCRFVFQDSAWHIQDLKSLNGTYLNDEKVVEALLCNGDTLRVGGFVFSVDLCKTEKTGKGGVVLSMTRILPGMPAEDKSSRQAG